MNSDILSRYDLSVDNRFIINIDVPAYKELYEYYDYSSTFIKRDLNERLVDYLMECAEELGPDNEYVIRVNLPKDQEAPDEENRVIYSLKSYFSYLNFLSKKKIKRITNRCLVSTVIAIILFVVSLLLHAWIPSPGYVTSVFIEGLSVAVWVVLWQVFSDYFFKLRGELAQVGMHDALLQTDVEFLYHDTTGH